MARNGNTPVKEDDQTPGCIPTKVPDSSSKNESSPSRRIRKKLWSANDGNVPNFHERQKDRDGKIDEAVSPQRKGRLNAKSNGHHAEYLAKGVQVPHRNSFPASEPYTLRRSSRGNAPKSGPQAYSKKWHPIDDLRFSNVGGRKNLEETSDSLSLNSPGRKKTSVPESSERGKSNQKAGAKDNSKASNDHEKPFSRPTCRRSLRNVYNADIAMKYDMSHHWSFQKLNQPKVFAKRLLEKQRLLESISPRSEEIDIQPVSPLPQAPQKSPKSRQDIVGNSFSKADARASASESQLSTSVPPENGPEKEQQSQAALPDTFPVVASPKSTSPMVSDEHLALHEQDFEVTTKDDISTHFPQKKNHGNHLVRPSTSITSLSLNPQPLDWNNLNKFDHRLYLLQRGAPADGNTLPFQWPAVQQILIGEGFEDSLGPKKDLENVDYLESRYETIRLGVEAFFKASEPEDNKDWMLFRTEGFKVYDKKGGRNYWKIGGENIVKPVKIIAEQKVLGPQISVSSRHQDGSSEPTEGHLSAAEPDIINDIRIQDLSATDTQIDQLLALAEPYGEVDSLLPHEKPTQEIATSITLGNDPEDLPDAVDSEQITHDQSEKTLVDLMRMTQPASRREPSTVEMEDIEALLNEVRSSQEKSSKPLTRPPKYASRSSPIKRRKRNTAEDFFSIYEDETDSDDLMHGVRQPLRELTPKLDLPVENMSTQELVPGSQERSSLQRSQHRQANNSNEYNYRTNIWPPAGENRSVFGGSPP